MKTLNICVSLRGRSFSPTQTNKETILDNYLLYLIVVVPDTEIIQQCHKQLNELTRWQKRTVSFESEGVTAIVINFIRDDLRILHYKPKLRNFGSIKK